MEEKSVAEIESNNELSIISSEEDIAKKILAAKSTDELNSLVDIFNVTQIKKNALRITELNKVLDCINNQIAKRVTDNPNQIANKELIDFMNAIQNQIDKANKTVNNVDSKPIVQINQQKVDVTVNNNIDKQNVIDAVTKLLNELNLNKDASEDDEIVDVNIIEEGENN